MPRPTSGCSKGPRCWKGTVRWPGCPAPAPIVDAVLGTGFEGEPRSPVSGGDRSDQRIGRPVVGCDIPSGVNASTGEAGLAVRAGRHRHLPRPQGRPRDRPGQAPLRRSPGRRHRHSGRRPRRRGGGPDLRRRARAAAAAGGRLDQVHLRPGLDRRRLARADRCGLPVPPRPRSGPAPATPPSPSRPTSNRSSRRS